MEKCNLVLSIKPKDCNHFTKMDPLIGDLTLTSKTSKEPRTDDYENPAIISTTFPRSIKQNEGYEIALKSIAHAPVKNIVRSDFKYIIKTTNEDGSSYLMGHSLNLSSRFYESQADILTEIYRILSSLADPPPMQLYEKGGETTLKFTPHHYYLDENEYNEKKLEFDYYLDFCSDIFLNRPFKYKRFEDDQEKTLNRRKRYYSEFEFTRKKGKIDCKEAILRIYDEFTWFKDQNDNPEMEWYEWWNKWWPSIEAMYKQWKNQADFIIQLKKEDWPKHEKEIKKVIEDISELRVLIEGLDMNVDQDHVDVAQREGKTQTKDHLTKLTKRMIDLESLEESILGRMERKMEYMLDDSIMEMRQVILGDDSSQLMATDTSNFVSTKDKDDVKATEITVSATPIVTTRLGFLYCSIIENSLINNNQSRLLCIFPIISKRGYSFYEINQTIYKTIAVLQFSTITFSIVDPEGDLVEFNLQGDELSNQANQTDEQKAKKKYPTILNLHIRKAL